MKYSTRFFFICLFYIIIFNSYSQTSSSIYSYKSSWWHDNIKGGDVIVKIEISKIDEKKVEFQLFYKWENISGVINTYITAQREDDSYNFTFIDDYGNKAFGQIRFYDNFADLYFDCTDYSDIGKNFRRMYGAQFKLEKSKK